jgi:catechol 2,3-dioxygenase-like lactoylglutathione lyase family enzyme
MHPFRIQRIDHIVLRVSDLERSIRFYQQVLGCELVKRREDLGGMVHLRAGASLIDLVDVQDPLGRWAVDPPCPASAGTSTICACASILLTKQRCWRIWPAMA